MKKSIKRVSVLCHSSCRAWQTFPCLFAFLLGQTPPSRTCHFDQISSVKFFVETGAEIFASPAAGNQPVIFGFYNLFTLLRELPTKRWHCRLPHNATPCLARSSILMLLPCLILLDAFNRKADPCDYQAFSICESDLASLHPSPQSWP